MKGQNKDILKKLAKSNIADNKIRNLVLTIAIAAVAIMLFTIMGAGISYFENFSTMNTRLKGTNAQGFLHDISDQQMKELMSMSEISNLGRQYYVGTIDYLENDSAVAVSAYGESEWKNNILPTLKNFKGKRPVKKDEIILSEAVIKTRELDIDTVLNQKIDLDININGKIKNESFIVVGTYEDFVASNVRNPGSVSGNILAASLQVHNGNEKLKSNCAVSEQLAMELCPQENIYVTFQIDQGENIAELIQDRLGLESTDNIMITQTADQTGQYLGILLAVAICLIVCICGYLCIYNIMNISLLKDIHFWGNMKAIGIGKKQLRYISDYQTNYFVLRSVPVGIVVGTVLTMGLVPLMLKTFAGSGGYSKIMPAAMKYNVWIFLATILFCYLTVFISLRKNIRMLSKLSPIEALRFHGESSLKKTAKRKTVQSRCGGKLYKMAYNNVFSDKKRFSVVVFTLFMGLFIFLLSYTLFSSPNWELYLDTEAPDDFCITDFTMTQNFRNEDKPDAWASNYLTESKYEQLAGIKGITDIEKVCLQPVLAESKQQLNDYRSEDPKEEAIWGTGVFVDEDKIVTYQLAHQKTFSKEDMENYVQGSAVYVSAAESGVYSDIEGQEIKLLNKETGKEAAYTIAGILAWDKDGDSSSDSEKLGETVSESYDKREKIRIFMSDAGLRKLVDEPTIYRININVSPDLEPYVKKVLREVIEPEDNVVVTVRSELLPTYKPVAASFLVIGTVFSIILLIIGVMNFINSLFTSIYTREKELAVLSSIGMSKRQTEKMLMYEGMYYAFATIILLGTAGFAVIYLFMKLTQEQFYFMEFVPPVEMLLLLLVLLSIICFLVPCITYKGMNKRSIVERLKNSEE